MEAFAHVQRNGGAHPASGLTRINPNASSDISQSMAMG